MKDMQVTAHVTLQVEVDASGSWNPNTTAAQIHEQAVKSAVGQIRGLVDRRGNLINIRLVGNPEVTTLIVKT